MKITQKELDAFRELTATDHAELKEKAPKQFDEMMKAIEEDNAKYLASQSRIACDINFNVTTAVRMPDGSSNIEITGIYGGTSPYRLSIKEGIVESPKFDFAFQTCPWLLKFVKEKLKEYVAKNKLPDWKPSEEKKQIIHDNRPVWERYMTEEDRAKNETDRATARTKKIASEVNAKEWFKARKKETQEGQEYIEATSEKSKKKYIIAFANGKMKIVTDEHYKEFDKVPTSEWDVARMIYHAIVDFETDPSTFTEIEKGIIFKKKENS